MSALDGFLRRARAALRPEFIEIPGEPDWHLPSFRMRSCDARDQVACSAAAHGWQSFEAPMPAAFARAVQQAECGLVIDVGANTGFYSLLALSVSASVSVVAYEPYAPVRRILQANLRQSPRRRSVHVLPYAASDHEGSGVLYVPTAAHGLVETSASLDEDFKSGNSTGTPVQIVMLDTQHRGGNHVAVIKVDAEGHDLEVLRGAVSLLNRDRPVVFLEVLLGADEAALTDLLRACGYTDVVLLPTGEMSRSDVVSHHTTAWNHMWLPAG